MRLVEDSVVLYEQELFQTIRELRIFRWRRRELRWQPPDQIAAVCRPALVGADAGARQVSEGTLLIER